jgi:uncharacterized protein DUF2461
MKALLTELRAAIDAAYPYTDLGEPKVFRIFRDVRFSKDKSPYKTHIGGYIPLARHVKTTTEARAEGVFARPSTRRAPDLQRSHGRVPPQEDIRPRCPRAGRSAMNASSSRAVGLDAAAPGRPTESAAAAFAQANASPKGVP